MCGKKRKSVEGRGRRQKFAWERAPCGGPAAGPCFFFFCLPAIAALARGREPEG